MMQNGARARFGSVFVCHSFLALQVSFPCSLQIHIATSMDLTQKKLRNQLFMTTKDLKTQVLVRTPTIAKNSTLLLLLANTPSVEYCTSICQVFNGAKAN